MAEPNDEMRKFGPQSPFCQKITNPGNQHKNKKVNYQ